MEEQTVVILGIAWYFVFIISASAHEAAHAFIAMKLGDMTAYHAGQVSLLPMAHIRREPFGMVIIPWITYVLGGFMIGWASAPYNAEWARQHPRREVWMSLAGPGANLILITLAGLLIHLGIMLGYFYMPESIRFHLVVGCDTGGIAAALATLVSILFSLNLVLFVFNLIPLPPLDGTALLHFILGNDAYNRYRRFIMQPSFRFIGLFAAWQVMDFIFSPIHTFALSILYPGSHWS